jgi:hypothetical protein
MKDLIDVPVLDYRYLIPSFPPLIILFSKGVENLITYTKNKKIIFLTILLVSSLIIVNSIISLNSAFFFANSGNAHLDGYTYAQKTSHNPIIYSHWPFVYSPAGNIYDIGQYSWVRDNNTYKSITTPPFKSGSILLTDNHFFPLNKFLNLNYTTINSKSVFLNPVLPKISENAIDTVYIGIVPASDHLAVLSEGFYSMEKWGSTSVYWTRNISDIKIYSQIKDNVTLTFTGQSISHSRTLSVFTNGNLISSTIVPVSPIRVTSELPLNIGENIISLQTSESCERPIDIPELKSSDPRCLSIAIQNITIT